MPLYIQNENEVELQDDNPLPANTPSTGVINNNNSMAAGSRILKLIENHKVMTMTNRKENVFRAMLEKNLPPIDNPESIRRNPIRVDSDDYLAIPDTFPSSDNANDLEEVARYPGLASSAPRVQFKFPKSSPQGSTNVNPEASGYEFISNDLNPTNSVSRRTHGKDDGQYSSSATLSNNVPCGYKNGTEMGECIYEPDEASDLEEVARYAGFSQFAPRVPLKFPKLSPQGSTDVHPEAFDYEYNSNDPNPSKSVSRRIRGKDDGQESSSATLPNTKSSTNQSMKPKSSRSVRQEKPSDGKDRSGSSSENESNTGDPHTLVHPPLSRESSTSGFFENYRDIIIPVVVVALILAAICYFWKSSSTSSNENVPPSKDSSNSMKQKIRYGEGPVM